MKQVYRYRGYDFSKMIITKGNGYWKLEVIIPNKIVVLETDIFPTKRAAKKYGMNILWDYTIKK